MSKLSFSKCIYDRSFFFSVLRSQQFKLEEIEEIYLIFYFSYQNESSSVPDDKLSFLRSFQSKMSLASLKFYRSCKFRFKKSSSLAEKSFLKRYYERRSGIGEPGVYRSRGCDRYDSGNATLR